VIQLSFGFGPVEAELWKLLFVMTRIGAALFAAPLFGAAAVPMQVRVIVTGAVAVLVCAWLPVTVPPALLSANGLLAVAAEVLVGLALGFVLQLAFTAPVIAAEVIGGTMGMSIATAADPNSGAHSPALGQYYSVTLILIFLGLGGHLQFLRLVVESYTALPPGAAWLGAERIAAVPQFAGTMLLAAVAIALPVTLVLLVVQLVAAVLSRSAPSLNLFSLGLPAGVLAGIAALIASAPLLGDQLGTLSDEGLTAVGGLLTR
jgi:flagellar biosynthesis protein FliR